MSAFRLLVPVKRVIDYSAKIRINASKTGVMTEGVRMSLNPFCEIAVEEAIRLREKSFAEDVTVVSIGKERVQDVLRTALAMGVDKAIRVDAEEGLHPLRVAQILKAVIEKESYDVVIMGKQAIDDDYNQTGQMLAGILQWPQATFASVVEVTNDGRSLQVQREIDGGLETIQVGIPAVVTTDLRLNEPRYATLPKIMRAKRETIEVCDLSDLKVEEAASQLTVIEIDEPEKRTRGVMVKSVEELVSKLRNERNVI